MRTAARRLHEAAPDLCASLCDSSTLPQARRHFDAWVVARRRAAREADPGQSAMRGAWTRKCLQVLDDITARRNEARLGESTLDWLWRLLRRVRPSNLPARAFCRQIRA